MKKLLGLALILILVLAACAEHTSPTPRPETPTPLPNTPISTSISPLPDPTITPIQSPLPSPEGDTMKNEEAPPLKTDVVNRAIADLAQRLSITSDEIILVSTQNDEFPAANFGCVDRFKTGSSTKKDSTLPGNLSQPDADVSPAFITATEIVLDVPSHATRYTYRGKGMQLVFCFEKGY